MWLIIYYQTFYEIKKSYFFVRMHKMADISKKAYGNNDIEVIVDGFGMLWLNDKHIEEK